MYGLDWIAKGYKKWMFLPKTTDAIFCKINEDNNVELHLIEFKFIASESNKSKINKLWKEIKNKNRIYNIFSNRFMQDFQNVKNNYADQMESNLQLKPYESLFIVLPELYDEYCKKNSIDKKDIKTYLNNIDKYLWICVGNKSRNESNVRVQAKHFEKYFKRMEQGIFKTAKVKTRSKFSKIINRIV